MSGITDSNSNLGPTTKPGLKLPSTGAIKPNADAPQAPVRQDQGDRLATVADATARAAQSDPGALVARIKQMQTTAVEAAPPPVPQAPPKPPRPRPPSTPSESKSNLGSALSNLAVGFLTSPRFVIKHAQNLLNSGTRIVNGSRRAKQLAVGMKDAIEEGRAGHFIQGNFRTLKLTAIARKDAAIKVVRSGKVQDLVKVLNGSKPTDVVNHGWVRFYGMARDEGLAPLQASAKAFAQTVDSGGNMPQIAEEAAKVGGRMGKVAIWAGRFGRVAPLLNVPLAAFDITSAVRSFRDPKASVRERVTKTGSAALTTAAAGLAIAGFFTPPPVNLALLGAAAGVGIASTVWSMATGRTAGRIASGVAHGVKTVGHWLGL